MFYNIKIAVSIIKKIVGSKSSKAGWDVYESRVVNLLERKCWELPPQRTLEDVRFKNDNYITVVNLFSKL